MPTNPPCPKQKKLTQWGIAVPTKKQGINNMNSKPLKTKKITYSQDWTAYNQGQTQEKILFYQLLYELTSLVPQTKYNGNGRPSANIGDMIFSCCLKTYLDFSSRRSDSDIQLVLKLGYINHAPHFNTVLSYLNKPEMKKILTKLIEISALPLKNIEKDFTVDSTGFSTVMYGQWLKKRNVFNEHRLFKKAHVMSGVETNIITHIEVTDGYMSDGKMLGALVSNTAKNFKMKEVSADKGYISEKNLQLIAHYGAIPYIPFRKDMKKTTEHRMILWKVMFRYFHEHQDEFMKHYHKRSNAESVFAMMKRKFGDYVRAKNSIAQENEILCKALCHNICVLIQETIKLDLRVNFSDMAQDFMCKIE